MADELVMNVKSNIKGITKDTEDFSKAIKDSASEVTNLSADIERAQGNVSGLRGVFGTIKNIVSSVGSAFGGTFDKLKKNIKDAVTNTEGLNKESTKLTQNIDISKKSTKKLADEKRKVGKETTKVTDETKKLKAEITKAGEETKKLGLVDFLKETIKSGKEVEKLSEGAEEVVDETEDIGKAAKKSSKSFGLMRKAVKGVATALKALGIIAIITAAFTALKEAMERNQKVMDLFNTVMTTISKTFNQVVDVITDVVKWTTESSDRFNGLGKVLGGLKTLFLTPIQLSFNAIKLAVQAAQLAWEGSWLGGGDEGKMAELRVDMQKTKDNIEEIGLKAIEAGKQIGNNIGDAIGELGDIYEKAAEGITKISIKGNFEQAKAVTAATKAALFAQEEFNKLNAQFLRDAELQRQIRDDETKSFAERIEANEKLFDILEDQQKLQREQVQKQIDSAALAVKQNASDENKLALLAAQNALLELEETITGQLSEQKTNQVSLEKELVEVRREVTNAGLEGLALELSELKGSYEMQLEMADKAGEDTLAITEKYLQDKKAAEDAAAQSSALLNEEGSKVGLERLQGEVDAEFEIRVEAAKKEQDLAKETADKKKAVAQEMLNNIASTLTSNLDAQASDIEKNYNKEMELAEANGKSTEEIEEKYEGKRAALAEKQKKLKIGLATIDMYQSAVAAYSQGMAVPPPAGLVLGPVSAGLAIAAGLANINSIMQTDVGGGGGGSVSATTATEPAPQMMS